MTKLGSRIGLAVALAALAGLAPGCTKLIQTPPQFLELDPAGHAFDYRATSADGIVLAARVLEFDEDRGGGLAFWVEAVTLQLGRSGEYAKLEERVIKTRDGLTGSQLRFGRDERGTPYQYWVTLVVESDELVVIEAGGPEEKLKAHEKRIAAAIESLSL